MPDKKNLGAIEEELLGSLNPVAPRQEFVGRLKHRLLSPPTVELENSFRINQTLPLIAGLFGGIILLWTLLRLVDYLTRRS